MPGFTHLQPAQTVRWSHWLMSHVAAWQRDDMRLRDLMPRVAMLPLGSGVHFLHGTLHLLLRVVAAWQCGFVHRRYMLRWRCCCAQVSLRWVWNPRSGSHSAGMQQHGACGSCMSASACVSKQLRSSWALQGAAVARSSATAALLNS